MQRRQFLQAGAASSALLAVPFAPFASASAPRFALGYHAGTPGASWQPALARSTPGATRVRVTTGGVESGSRRVQAHIDLVYRAAGLPVYCLASLHRPSQRVALELDADALAGLRVHYTRHDADGLAHELHEDLAFTDALLPLLAPGTYALLGAHSGARLPSWSALAAPQGCGLGRCDGAAADFDALLIHVAAA